MFEWKVEDMVLLNQKGGVFLGKEKIYDCESKVSREDKIAFVDSLQDGKLSYILALVEKFNEERETMPKDQWGNVKTVSLKAWIKRNDDRKLLDDTYRYGDIRIIGGRNIESIALKGGYDTYDAVNDILDKGIVKEGYEDYVDEIFHHQLCECEKEEKRYFLEHDEYSILKKKFRDRDYHTTFGVHIIASSDGNIYVGEDFDTKREITMDELKDLLAKYEQLDALVEKLTAEIKKLAKQPVIMKLTPNVTDITEIAKAAEAGGADAISLINTLTGMKIDIHRRGFVLANKTGGVSGPAIHPIAVRMVYQVAHAVDIPVVGMGGVSSAEDVIEMMLAGATAVEIGAANLVNPYICKEIIEDLPRVMEKYNIKDLNDIIGGARK